MKRIVYNADQISEKEITDSVIRVKAILINSLGEVLLGYSYHQYQFIGGHVEAGETLEDAVCREVLEETGILLDKDSLKPDALMTGYIKDWPIDGRHTKTSIYYFVIYTDQEPDIQKVAYTSHESKGKFELRMIPLKDLKQELTYNADIYETARGIAKEMILMLEKLDLVK